MNRRRPKSTADCREKMSAVYKNAQKLFQTAITISFRYRRRDTAVFIDLRTTSSGFIAFTATQFYFLHSIVVDLV